MPPSTRKQAIAIGSKTYLTGKPCKRGHISERSVSNKSCLQCRAAYDQENRANKAAYAKRYREENIERIRQYDIDRRKDDGGKHRAASLRHYYENRDKRMLAMRAYYNENNAILLKSKRIQYIKSKERIRNYNRQYSKDNLPRLRTINATRRARQIKAQPNWVKREELLRIYNECPSNYHVDHGIPLHHKLVCGLHVPNNLKAIPAEANLHKNNYFDPSEWSYDQATSTFVRTISPDAPDFGYYDESKKDHEEWKNAA